MEYLKEPQPARDALRVYLGFLSKSEVEKLQTLMYAATADNIPELRKHLAGYRESKEEIIMALMGKCGGSLHFDLAEGLKVAKANGIA